MKSLEMLSLNFDINAGTVTRVERFSDGQERPVLLDPVDLVHIPPIDGAHLVRAISHDAEGVGEVISPIAKGAVETHCVHVPPAVRTIRFAENKYRSETSREYRVPCPRMLMFVDLARRDGAYHFAASRAYALAGPLRSSVEPVFHYPGWNMWGTGGVCWGDYEHPAYGLHEIARIPLAFFHLMANRDLENYLSDRSRYSTVVEMLEDLQGKPRFPEDKLKLRNVSFAEVVSNEGGLLTW